MRSRRCLEGRNGPKSADFSPFRFSLRIFGHSQSVDKGDGGIGEEDSGGDDDDFVDRECAFATEEESEKMAAAVRSEGPSNLAEKLIVSC